MNHYQRKAAAKRETTAKSDRRGIAAMVADAAARQATGKGTPAGDAALRVAGLDPLYNMAHELGAVLISESPIQPRRQPAQVVTVVEPVNAAPADTTTHFKASAPDGMVKAYLHLAIMAHHLKLVKPLSLLWVAKELNPSGSGKIAKEALREALHRFGITRIGKRHFDNLIDAGAGAGLWNIHKGTHLIDLASPQTLTGKFSARLFEQGKGDIVDSCLPTNPLFISVGGSFKQVQSTLYTNWLYTRQGTEGFHASRKFIASLWNCDEKTLRGWEAGQVKVTRNYAQYGGQDARMIPTHATPYTDNNGEVRYTWRIANTYIVTSRIIEHSARNARRSKCRSVWNHVKRQYQLDRTPDEICPLERTKKLYFHEMEHRKRLTEDKCGIEKVSAFTQVKDHLKSHKDYQRRHYAYLGDKQGWTSKGRRSKDRVRLYECYDPLSQGQRRTELEERNFAFERRKAFQDAAAFDTAMRGKYTC